MHRGDVAGRAFQRLPQCRIESGERTIPFGPWHFERLERGAIEATGHVDQRGVAGAAHRIDHGTRALANRGVHGGGTIFQGASGGVVETVP